MGLRTLAFDPDQGFFLNGVNRKVKGVCLHHNAGVLGAVVPEEVWERRLLLNLKAIGANAIRTAHNPQMPVFYDLWTGWACWLGTRPLTSGSTTRESGWKTGMWVRPRWTARPISSTNGANGDVTDKVRRDRNHPSIFLWSIGNEVDYPNDPYSHPILDGGNLEFSQPLSGGYKPYAPDAKRIGMIAKRLARNCP